jgi:hypothetical protein
MFVFFNDIALIFVLGIMVLNATFNNISLYCGNQLLLMEEPEVTRENHQPYASH